MSPTTTAKTISIEEFVAGLRALPESSFDNPSNVLQFLQSTIVDPSTLRDYINWDAQHYTRNLIDRTATYELMAICWEVGQASSVHNHRDQNCWMAVPIGRLLVQNYRVLQQQIDEGRCELANADTVEMNLTHPCAVDPLEPVHRVLNARDFNQRAVSLHIYSRPFDSCVVYSPERGTCGEIKLQFTTQYGKVV
jgi:cysteine dioxygenase